MYTLVKTRTYSLEALEKGRIKTLPIAFRSFKSLKPSLACSNGYLEGAEAWTKIGKQKNGYKLTILNSYTL